MKRTTEIGSSTIEDRYVAEVPHEDTKLSAVSLAEMTLTIAPDGSGRIFLPNEVLVLEKGFVRRECS